MFSTQPTVAASFLIGYNVIILKYICQVNNFLKKFIKIWHFLLKNALFYDTLPCVSHFWGVIFGFFIPFHYIYYINIYKKRGSFPPFQNIILDDKTKKELILSSSLSTIFMNNINNPTSRLFYWKTFIILFMINNIPIFSG